MDLIQVRNPNLFKDMFQETLYEQKKTATLEVLKVSKAYPSLVNDNDKGMIKFVCVFNSTLSYKKHNLRIFLEEILSSLDLYPFSFAYSKTSAFVSAETSKAPFKAFETVDTDKCKASAMSFILINTPQL